ncbi:MAG: hypothetical protein P8Z79_04180 [Sedimentisphaerales bacterium]|jgi:hypothetical protein
MSRLCKHLHSIALLIVILLLSFSYTCSGQTPPDVNELIERYEKALLWEQRLSIHVHSVIRVLNGAQDESNRYRIIDTTYRRDGNRYEWIGDYVGFPDETQKHKMHATKFIYSSNPQRYLYGRKDLHYDEKVFAGGIWRQDTSDVFRTTVNDPGHGAFLLGYLPMLGKTLNLIELFKKSGTVRIIGKENINDSLCYMLEAKTELGGMLTIWMAPDKGYNVLKVRHESKSGRSMYLIDSIEIKQVDGCFVPISGRYFKQFTSKDGTEVILETVSKFGQIELNPDFEAMGAFDNPLPDGSLASDMDFPGQGIRYVWSKDKKSVWDEREGRYLYVPKDWERLVRVGEALPALTELAPHLKAERIKDKSILVCFFDMNQRLSRRMLTERADKFKEKGIFIVAVQASLVDQAALNTWREKYNVPFSIGMVSDDGERTRFEWCARLLPWLILTDTKHIVSAQGFSLSELDKKIAER